MADGQNEMPDAATESTETSPADVAEPGAPSPATDAPEEKAPKWDGEFDPDRAAKLVSNLRGDNEKLKKELAELRSALGEKEQATKSELQKLIDRAETAEKELSKLRTQSLISAKLREHGLPDDLSEFVSGSTEDEITAKVEKLAEKFGPKAPVPGKPRPKLVPGEGSGTGRPDFDPEAIAKKIRERI